jgi:glutaminase
MSNAIAKSAGTVLLATLLCAGPQAQNLRAADIEAALDAAYTKYRNLQEGANADYIPALAKVDPNIYGIVAVEQYRGSEMNAMVNPGAITATSMVSGASREEVWNKILSFHSDFAGRPLVVNQEVYESEAATNQRNQAIGRLIYAYGHIKDNPDQVTDKQVMSTENVPEVLAVMATAGLYDDTGKWLFQTGLPAKSGVGGGIIAVSPGKFGIAVISPPLDAAGNSVRAQRAIADISNALGGNPYAVRAR